MSVQRFDPVAIPIAAARRGELRVCVPSAGAVQVDLEVFPDPRAVHAEASVSLTPDGARALIHALQTALEEAGEARERPRLTVQARDMRSVRARAA